VDRGTFFGLLTLLAMVGFIAITLWAWSSKRTTDFERAARAPLEEDERGGGDGR
jgi:cytochrome c oxidase cbb3-type subunit 4